MTALRGLRNYRKPRWTEAAIRLAQSSVLSIAVIRGRVRAGADEFALADDIPFASPERAMFGQPEEGFGLVPGGGGLQRLPLLVGSARTLEIVVGGDDFDAETAERYGWITRAGPDSSLDRFVASFVRRVLSFDKQDFSTAKTITNRSGFRATRSTFGATLTWPAALHRLAKLRELSFGIPGEFELDLGRKSRRTVTGLKCNGGIRL